MRLFNVGSEKLLKAGFAEHFLHGGDTENFALIGVEACAFNSSGNNDIVGVFPIGTAFDQFPAGPFLTADSLLKGIFLHIRSPGGQRVDLAQNVGDLFIVKKCRSLEVVTRKGKIRFGAFSTLGFCLTEAAPIAAAEVALSLVCQLCLFSQFGVCLGE